MHRFGAELHLSAQHDGGTDACQKDKLLDIFEHFMGLWNSNLSYRECPAVLEGP